MVRDRLCMGVLDRSVQRSLLKVPDLTLQVAVEVALAEEASRRDQELIGRRDCRSPTTRLPFAPCRLRRRLRHPPLPVAVCANFVPAFIRSCELSVRPGEKCAVCVAVRTMLPRGRRAPGGDLLFPVLLRLALLADIAPLDNASSQY